MQPAQQIDQFIAAQTDWRGTLVGRLRAIILEVNPRMTEEWKWEPPFWSHQGLVCLVGLFKQTVKLNFFQGAVLGDPHSLFNAGLNAKKNACD
jgi:hypothetical protein